MRASLALEPDQAERMALNLLHRTRERFVIELSHDPRVKDVAVLHRGAVFEERAGFDYLRCLASHMDEACQYVVNLIHAELSFEVTPQLTAEREEWLIRVEMPKR